MKRIVISFLFILITACTFAQSHTYDACCRYGKGNVTGDCICPACKKDKDDNNKVLQEEAKQLQAKAAAENAQKEAAIKKANEDLAKKKEVEQKQTNTITIGSPNAKKEPEKLLKKATSTTNNVVMNPFISREGKDYFGVYEPGYMNPNHELLFFLGPDIEYSSESFQNNTYHYNYPKNLGLGRIAKLDGNGGVLPVYCDIYYPTGKREFNDNSIKWIYHLKDNFFLLDVYDKGPYLYDIKSKKKTKLPDNGSSNRHIDLGNYTPIFDDTDYKIDSYINRTNGKSVMLKKKALERFPDKISDELLRKYSFCLIIGYENYISSEYVNINNWHPQFVYVSKTGEITIK